MEIKGKFFQSSFVNLLYLLQVFWTVLVGIQSGYIILNLHLYPTRSVTPVLMFQGYSSPLYVAETEHFFSPHMGVFAPSGCWNANSLAHCPTPLVV